LDGRGGAWGKETLSRLSKAFASTTLFFTLKKNLKLGFIFFSRSDVNRIASCGFLT
jgi:hypothetical protein